MYFNLKTIFTDRIFFFSKRHTSIIIIIILLFWEFFTPVLADGFSLKFVWQQVF